VISPFGWLCVCVINKKDPALHEGPNNAGKTNPEEILADIIKTAGLMELFSINAGLVLIVWHCIYMLI
jgi:hypothetical protein